MRLPLRILDRLPGWAAGLSVALGLAGIAAWTLGASVPALLAPLLRMQFNSALSVLAGGLGLLALARTRRLPALAAGTWLIAIGGATLVEYALGVDLAIDRLLFDSGLISDNPHPGRMGANAAGCFTLLGAGLTLLARNPASRAAILVSLACAVTVSISSAWVLALCAAPSTAAGSLYRFAQMAPPTALALGALGAGAACLALRQGRAWLGSKLGARVPVVAWVVLGAALLVTVTIWYATARNVVQVADGRFGAIAERMTLSILGRMRDHEQVLLGVRGLLLSSREVTRTEWRDYMAQQELSTRFRGVLGVGLAPRVEPAQRGAHVARVRAEGGEESSAYRIVPEVAGSASYPVEYVEPFSGANLLVFGFDLYSDPVRREAMQRACASGTLAISGRTALRQDADTTAQRGFLMFLPVAAPRAAAEDPADPCRHVRAFIYSPLRTAEVLDDIVAADLRSVDLRLLDGAGPGTDALFDTAARGAAEPGRAPPLFELVRSVPMGGRTWTLLFSSRPAFGEQVAYHQPVVAMLGGALVSVLLFGLTWSLVTTRTRALALAEEMTLRLRDSEQQYRRLVDDSRGLICMHDLDGVLTYVNPAAAEALGRAPEALVGTRLADLIAPEVRQYTAVYLAKVRAERRHHGTMIVVDASGKQRIWIYDNSLREVPGQAPYVLGHAQDVTELQESQRALEEAHAAMREMATRDALTGLCNRRLFYEHLERALELARRESTVLAVLFVDLDHFKQVNDTLGHRAGDELLKHVADALRACTRKSDVAARLGGDEFTLLLSNLREPAEAARVALKVGEELRRPLHVEGKSVTVSGSIGIATFPADGADSETLLQRADEAMYEVKHGGRDGFRFRSDQG